MFSLTVELYYLIAAKFFVPEMIIVANWPWHVSGEKKNFKVLWPQYSLEYDFFQHCQ
jgi:hypothetical protein